MLVWGLISVVVVLAIALIVVSMARRPSNRTMTSAESQILAQGGTVPTTGLAAPMQATPVSTTGPVPVPGIAQVPGVAGGAFAGFQFGHLTDLSGMTAMIQQSLAQAGITIDPEKLKNAHVFMNQPQVFTMPPKVMQAGMPVGSAAPPGWVEGSARMASVTPMGVTVNDQTVVQVELDVTIAGAAPFHVSAHTMAPTAKIPLVSPGESIPVHVNPADHNQIAVEWDRAS